MRRLKRTAVVIGVPAVTDIEWRGDKRRVRHVSVAAWGGEATLTPLKTEKAKGFLADWGDEHPKVFVQLNRAPVPDRYDHVLRVGRGWEPNDGLEEASWYRHPKGGNVADDLASCETIATTVRESWRDVFRFRLENLRDGTKGLRRPQLGALHALLAHWVLSDDPATVVMPTGTGKTETMLAALVVERCERLMVVVPTDALRTQLADKFLTLGVLRDKEYRVVDTAADFPVVGTLSRRLKMPEEVDALFRRCNVIISTMAVAGQCPPDVRQRMAALSSHLFIDEAHHVAAPTWDALRADFKDRRIVQFTATPYRQDERPVPGRVVFNYPLRRAQQDGYFQTIDFEPVIEFDPRKRDSAIADKAVQVLRAQMDRGHILMARVGSVPRAEEVYEVYRRHDDLGVVQLHTGIGSQRERHRIRNALLRGEVRIVVCVDMLGEGFDLPELKVAAFHDVRRSLPVTLQLVGRFARTRPDLGHATVIANIGDVQVEEELRKLYMRDADWNHLLPLASEQAIREEQASWEFIEGFGGFPDELSLQNIRPAMSAVAYRTHCAQWSPENFREGIRGIARLDHVYDDLNKQGDTLIVFTAQKVPVDWAKSDDVFTWDWQLYVLHWDESQELLFIHNSSNSGFFKELAKAVAGADVQRVEGPDVFRIFGGVNRLRLQNVGLLEQLGRLIRFTMRAGSDVEPALSEAQKRKAVKSNVFGGGFENGRRVTAGCSYRGRLWSRQQTNLRGLVDWCRATGTKLLDKTIDPERVLAGTLVPKAIAGWPGKVPLAADWPEVFFRHPEQNISVAHKGRTLFLHEVDLSVQPPNAKHANARFVLSGEGMEIGVELEFFEEGGHPSYRFTTVEPSTPSVQVGHAEWALPAFFEDHPPTVWFADGSSLDGNLLVELPGSREPFPRERIEVWDWTGTDIRKEAQGIQGDEASIQRRVIEHALAQANTVVFDDDGHGEAADVIALGETDEGLGVTLYHCKYSHADTPGARLEDLYEVCGQAQKSVRWAERATELFMHMMRREPKRRHGRERTRFELGSQDDLMRIIERSHVQRTTFEITVVQPGIASQQLEQRHLELLGVTENYLKETFGIPLSVVGGG